MEGFGTTLASVALLVGLGAMIGELLEVTAGAQVLADTLVGRFGERRAPLALGIASPLSGFPIFFDAGFVVFLPIIFSVARRFGGSVLLYALPAAGAFAVMHAFVPPHPGPVGAAGILGAGPVPRQRLGFLAGRPVPGDGRQADAADLDGDGDAHRGGGLRPRPGREPRAVAAPATP